jgi:hypothetical protein
MTDMLLVVLVFGPFALSLLLKSNAALAFLSLSAGTAVVTYGGDDINKAIQQLGLGPYSTNTVELFLLIVPLVVTLLVTRKTVANRSKSYFQAVSALCAGGLLALAAVPLLNGSGDINFSDSSAWINLQKFQAAIVGIGALCALVTVWSASLKKHSGKSKKH